MSELRDEVHAAALIAISGERPLEAILARAERRRLVRDARDWYLETHGGDAVSSSRTCARDLVRIVRSGGSTLDAVTLMEYDDGMLIAVDADPPTSVDRAASII